jgi:hypothetical protein
MEDIEKGRLGGKRINIIVDGLNKCGKDDLVIEDSIETREEKGMRNRRRSPRTVFISYMATRCPPSQLARHRDNLDTSKTRLL